MSRLQVYVGVAALLVPSLLLAEPPVEVMRLAAEMRETGGLCRGGATRELGLFVVGVGRARYRENDLAYSREIAEINAKKQVSAALRQSFKAKDMATVKKEHLQGGTGAVDCTVVVPQDLMIHARLFNLLALHKGDSIGVHEHHNEVEYYYILKGQGIVSDKDGESTACVGDVVVTGWGASHAIRNEGDEDLVFLAVISTEK